MTDLGKAEILREIKVAEEKVRKMTAEAEEKRKQLQAEGKRMSLDKNERADAESRKELDSAVAAAKSRIEEKKRSLLEDGNKAAANLSLDSSKRAGAAKQFVLSEFERAIDA